MRLPLAFSDRMLFHRTGRVVLNIRARAWLWELVNTADFRLSGPRVLPGLGHVAHQAGALTLPSSAGYGAFACSAAD